MYQSHTGISVKKNADLHVKIQMQIEICNFTLIFAIDIISAVLNHFFAIAIFHVNTQLIVANSQQLILYHKIRDSIKEGIEMYGHR